MNRQHTPGPWTATTDGEANFSGIATEKNWLLRIQQNGELSLEEEEANTALIEAAPDLLESLEKIINRLNFSSKEIDEARAVIRKAKRGNV